MPNLITKFIVRFLLSDLERKVYKLFVDTPFSNWSSIHTEVGILHRAEDTGAFTRFTVRCENTLTVQSVRAGTYTTTKVSPRLYALVYKHYKDRAKIQDRLDNEKTNTAILEIINTLSGTPE